jgi:hypothetical protein
MAEATAAATAEVDMVEADMVEAVAGVTIRWEVLVAVYEPLTGTITSWNASRRISTLKISASQRALTERSTNSERLRR